MTVKGRAKSEVFTFYMVLLIVVVLLAGIFVFMEVVAPSFTIKEYTGYLFVSDAGESHGGFEYTASWNASMKIVGSSGVLNLTLNTGLGDALTQHSFKIAQFKSSSPDNLSFMLGNSPVTMVNVTRDEIWNGSYNNYYTASWGGYATSSELIGTIKPAAFPGLVSFWYVELRLR